MIPPPARIRLRGRLQDPAEELANSITHGVGLGLSIIGLVVLIIVAALQGTAWHIAGCTVFGLSLVALYTASTLYHTVTDPQTKKFLRLVDHIGIYLLIAGTYTPFTLTLLRGGLGWTLFGIVWGMAVFGIAFKWFFRHKFPKLSLMLYLAMGWVIVIAAKEILTVFPVGALVLTALGGLFYSAGTYFYVQDFKRYFHTIWHGFVLAGSSCHFTAILIYCVNG